MTEKLQSKIKPAKASPIKKTAALAATPTATLVVKTKSVTKSAIQTAAKTPKIATKTTATKMANNLAELTKKSASSAHAKEQKISQQTLASSVAPRSSISLGQVTQQMIDEAPLENKLNNPTATWPFPLIPKHISR
jgi:hypothetical protein